MQPETDFSPNPMQGFRRRFSALLRKETHQMLRDPSNLLVGLLLPLVLILLFGYGLSFDVEHAPVAVVMEDTSPTAQNVLSGLQGSPYLAPLQTGDMQTATRLFNRGEVDAVVRVPSDFSAQLAAGQAKVQLIVNGLDTNTANTLQSYVGGAIGNSTQIQADRSGSPNTGGGVSVMQRMWFNEAGYSTWYLVPGLLVLVLTLIGAFLTSLLIAREWERGTLESLFVTPVRPLEIMLAKIIPYLGIGAVDLVMCLLAAHFLFEVPIRGSLPVLIAASMLYLLVSLGIGLVISGKTRNQFQASQVALLASFMPAMMLSGFVFDIRNMPQAVQIISHLLPATYFMELVKTLFLAGNYWPLIVKNSLILTGYAVLLLWLATRTLKKTLGR